MQLDQAGRGLVTRSTLASDLRRAGISPDAVVCAHVSLKSLGFVCGGPQTVIEGLQDAVGPHGTVMMPTFTGELSDPATWRYPPVPEDWVEPIRAETPPFDPALTPTRGMGTVAELFRHRPGALRSNHPHSSFAALGADAQALLSPHDLSFRFGPASPLGRLAALDGTVLLLGAGVERASFVYLAQHMAGLGALVTKSSPVRRDGATAWVDYEDIAVENRLVSSGVEHLLAQGVARTAQVGDARTILFRAREALAALLDWKWAGLQPHVAQLREATPLPKDWSDWLAPRASA